MALQAREAPGVEAEQQDWGERFCCSRAHWFWIGSFSAAIRWSAVMVDPVVQVSGRGPAAPVVRRLPVKQQIKAERAVRASLRKSREGREAGEPVAAEEVPASTPAAEWAERA